MKKKVGIVVVIGIMLLGTSTLAGINAPFLEDAKEEHGEEIALSMEFLPPMIKEDDKYAVIESGNDMTCLMNEGFPLLPYRREVITFPFGTKIEGIEVTTSDVNVMQLDKKIKPAPKPIPVGTGNARAEIKEEELYCGNEPYPSDWCTYNIGAGIDGDEHVIFLSIHAYPCRYIPANNELLFTEEMNIKVSYEPPEKPLLQNDAYDLVIIAPSEFSDALQPLVEHKESHGLKTKLIMLSEIYGGTYFTSQGRDDAEKVKYFIKDAIEEWGITYVLLVGGLTSKISGDIWYVPVRYSNLADTSGYAEYSYLTDLYFADIYKDDGEGGLAFDDWDSNGNGVFAEWSWHGKDILDLYPDVYVGRLACRDMREVSTVVEKIINYENECDPSWFKRVMLAGGDTFNDIRGYNYLEGEIANQKVAEILDDFEAEKVWWTLGNFKQQNVVNAIGEGCGFVHLSGHGSPGMWMAKDFTEDPNGKYLLGLDVYHMPLLSNEGKYPIVIIGGCHNSMFNATFMSSLVGCIQSLTGNPTWYWMPIPECFGWWFVKQQGGGAIATFGCTGLGIGAVGDGNRDGIPDSLQNYLTWLELRFFEVYAENGVDVLGATWGAAINDYVNTFSCNSDKSDRKTVEEWALLGDPSLKIGGYP